jgi:hypothetical protein
MPDFPKKTYEQTSNKIRTLWEQANYLIAKHEALLEKLNTLEQKVKQLNSSLNGAIEGTNNV